MRRSDKKNTEKGSLTFDQREKSNAETETLSALSTRKKSGSWCLVRPGLFLCFWGPMTRSLRIATFSRRTFWLLVLHLGAHLSLCNSLASLRSARHPRHPITRSHAAVNSERTLVLETMPSAMRGRASLLQHDVGSITSSSTDAALIETASSAEQRASPAGRGRGMGRAHLYFGPSEFDDSWWLPPPPIGADPFLQGYSSHVYPRHSFGFSGMPKGGVGNANHFWGGPSYHYPLNMPWWRGRAFNSRARSAGSPYLPYYTPRDSYGGIGQSASLNTYYATPPALQGDWNLPKVRRAGRGRGLISLYETSGFRVASFHCSWHVC